MPINLIVLFTGGGKNLGDITKIEKLPSSRMQHHRGTVQKGTAQTLTTMGGNNVGVVDNLRIRKLTPRECYRLMGWKDEDIDKIQATNISNTQQYKQAGNGIVVQVLEAIFKEMFLETDENKNQRYQQLTIFDILQSN